MRPLFFKCPACRATNDEGYEYVAIKGDFLVLGFSCPQCGEDCTAELNRAYLFGEPPALPAPELPNPKPIEWTEADKGFLEGLHIKSDSSH